MLRKAARLLVLGATALLSGCLSPGNNGTTIWVVDGDERVRAGSAPRLETDVYSASRGELRLDAARNESVAFQVVFRPNARHAGPYQIRFTDLEGPAGTLESAATYRVFRSQYVRADEIASWYPAHVGEPIASTLVLDKLVPWDAPIGGGPLILTESRNEAIWIDLHVPSDAEPGEYRGTVSVEQLGGPLARPRQVWQSTVALRVLSVEIPSRRGLPVVCRIDPRDLLKTHLRWPDGPAETMRLLPTDASHQPAIELVNEAMRLFQSHRTNPLLWASFPPYAPAASGQRQALDVHWDTYDTLVEGWLDGSAFDDGVPLDFSLVPASIEYPSAERNGGLSSAGYAALFSAYLRACRDHFDERGWLDRALIRVLPPAALTVHNIEQTRIAEQLVRRSETNFPFVAHLPTRSLRGLGWIGAPPIAGIGAAVWAPPASWVEPEEVATHTGDGRGVWFMPDRPPYSPSLAPEAPPTDARMVAWLAYRYDMGGVWIEDAAKLGPGLVHSGVQHGLVGQPLPSMRLKRLLRGLQDYELLKLLEKGGQQLLARRIAERVVRWAFTDACRDNLLDAKETGWSTSPETLRLARRLILSELDPQPDRADARVAWNLLFNQADRVRTGVDGVRLEPLAGTGQGIRAVVRVSVTNASDRPLEGTWRLSDPPRGWALRGATTVAVPPGARRSTTLAMDVAGWGQDPTGAYPFEISLDTAALGSFSLPARLAVATCGELARGPMIDGRLDDWPLAATNALGDFQLVRGERDGARSPTLPTLAFVGMDEQALYIAVRATLRPGERPIWSSDNRFAVDGAIPWGQDVIELLLAPARQTDGTSDLLYCVRIKPSGITEATRGATTDPPVGNVQAWVAGLRVASKLEHDVWIVEAAIPLDAFDAAALDNPIWGFNVARLDARRGEYSSWSGAVGYCYAPASLGNMLMQWPR